MMLDATGCSCANVSALCTTVPLSLIHICVPNDSGFIPANQGAFLPFRRRRLPLFPRPLHLCRQFQPVFVLQILAFLPLLLNKAVFPGLVLFPHRFHPVLILGPELFQFRRLLVGKRLDLDVYKRQA